MRSKSYKALRIFKKNDTFKRLITDLNTQQLPDHEVLVRVHYSSLNYKDALSASGHPGITNSYPHTPGIDAAGVVEWSDTPQFKKGEEVICTSYDLGMNTDGGFGRYIRVPSDWVLPLPVGLSLKESMQLGTAGLTAGIGVYKLEQSLKNDSKDPILVTGATGGVGSLAISILQKRGFSVTAATGKTNKHDYLKQIGASEVIGRREVTDSSDHMLLSGRWMGAIETVGGPILDTVLRSTRHNGVVTCCGNAASHKLETNVYPFILRGVHLLGIDSGICKMPFRRKIWEKLAGEYKPDTLDTIALSITLEQLPREIDRILEGGQVGRKFVDLR